MATFTPSAYLRFAADHCVLLEAIYREKRVNDARLLELIRRHERPQAPLPGHVLEQLCGFGFVEPAPDETATYEMTRAFGNLLGMLLHEHRLTSAKTIQSYLDDLQGLSAELDSAIGACRGDTVVRVLREVDDVVERMRQDSRQNHDGIVAEVEEVKANRERMRPLERYEKINRLWQRYVLPLRDMVDTRKALDAALDELNGILRAAATAFETDRPVASEVVASRARLIRLHREVANDFREAFREIVPLYRSLRRESLVAQGAAKALETLRRQGVKELALEQRLALIVWRVEGLLSNGALSGYLYGIRDYRPRPPDALGKATAVPPTAYLDPEELAAAVAAARPFDDCLAWLLATYPELPLSQLLTAYARLYFGDFGEARSAAEPRQYHREDVVLTAHPLELAAEHG